MRLSAQAPPALPSPAPVYTAAQQNSLVQVLRLYFNTLFNFTKALASGVGIGYLQSPHGAFSSVVNQAAVAADTPTIVALELTDYANEMHHAVGDGVYVNNSGIYNYQFSLQFENPTSQFVEVSIWLKKNGVDLASTGSKYTISYKHGAINGYLIVVCNFFVSLNAGDYVGLWWATTDALVIMEAYAAQVAPYAMPAVPSAVATLSFVSAT